MSGNHARDNYYQPGALIHIAEADIKDGGRETSTYYDSWRQIESYPNNNPLSITYTPPVDAIAFIYGQAWYRYSEAGANLYFAIWRGDTCLASCHKYVDTANAAETFATMHYMELDADTQYTFAAKYYIAETSGTLTIYEEKYETFLHLLVWRKP